MAATLETSARGVIYEHAAASVVAQRLANELKAMLAEMRQQGVTVYDGEAAIVLRAIEQGARDARTPAAVTRPTLPWWHGCSRLALPPKRPRPHRSRRLR